MMSSSIVGAGQTWEASTCGPQYLRIPVSVWVLVALVAAALAAVSPNPGLTAFSVLVLPVCAKLAWRIGEPPVLVFALGVQWLQASMKVFHANFLGIGVNELGQSWSTERAVVLSLVGVLVLAAGMRIAMTRVPSGVSPRLFAETVSYSIWKVWWAYLVFFVLAVFQNRFLWAFPGLSQPLLALMEGKWIFFYLLALIVAVRREHWGLLAAAAGLELLVGLTGFFSDFKRVFFVLGLVYLTTGHAIGWKTMFRLSLIVFAVLYLAVVWASVKKDYRAYVSMYSGEQVMAVSRADALDKMAELYSALNWNGVQYGIEELAKRVAYVDYFAAAMDTVPAQVPHEGGSLWNSAIRHVLIPRLFWHDKPALVSDTLITEKYTGRNIIIQAGIHTSVPLGYIAESYIDFGVPLMFVPIFAVGLLWGGIYRYFITHAASRIFGYGIAVAILTKASQLEVSSVKLLGGMLMAFIVMALALRFVIPSIVHLLSESESRRS